MTAFHPLTGRRQDEIEMDGTPDALAYGDHSIWVLDTLQGEIIRVDPLTGHDVARISVPGNLKERRHAGPGNGHRRSSAQPPVDPVDRVP